MKKTFETQLPEGYRQVYIIDAKQKKTGILINAAALVVTLAILIPAFYCYWRNRTPEKFTIGGLLLFYGGMVLYVVLHELTHGAAYKLLTGQKLRFGFTLSVAYCGVPDIYVYRNASMLAMLAPFAVFTVVFGTGALLAATALHRLLWMALLGIHLGGCCGDLYGALVFALKFSSPDTLLRDTGPTQIYYMPGEKSAEPGSGLPGEGKLGV